MLDAPDPAPVAPARGAGGPPPVGDGVWSPGRRRLTVGLVLTITLVAFESLAVATVMPKVEDDIGGLALYGWVFSGFFLASLAGIVVTGVLTDRRGPVVPFAAGLVIFAAGLLAGGLATSMEVLVAARLAQGFGAGAIPASAYAAVARGYPPPLRPRIFAIFSTAWVIPGIVGPSLATVVERYSSWHWVFLGLIPLVVVAAAIAVPALGSLGAPSQASTSQAWASDRTRLVLVAMLVLGVGLVLAAGTVRSGAATAGFLVVGLPLGALAFVRLVPAGTIRLRPGLPAVVAVRGILTWSFFGVDAYVSLAVTEGEGGSTFLAGVVLSVTAVLWTVGSWTQERLVARVGPRRLDTCAFLLLAASSAGMVVVALALPAWTATIAWGLGGLAMGLGYAPLSLSALGSADPGTEGSATAALQLCDTLGTSLGTGAGGAVLAFADGRSWEPSAGVAVVFAIGIVVAALGVVAAQRLPLRVPGLSPAG